MWIVGFLPCEKRGHTHWLYSYILLYVLCTTSYYVVVRNIDFKIADSLISRGAKYDVIYDVIDDRCH